MSSCRSHAICPSPISGRVAPWTPCNGLPFLMRCPSLALSFLSLSLSLSLSLLSLSLSLSLALSGNMLQYETREREHTAKPAPCLAATWGQAARFSRALIHPTQGRSTCKTHRHPDTDTQTQTHMTFTTLAPRTLHKVCQRQSTRLASMATNMAGSLK